MTPESVARAVEYVRSLAGDPELAHGAEDSVHMAVLLAIVDGEIEDPQECARIALTTRDLDFPRWMA